MQRSYIHAGIYAFGAMLIAVIVDLRRVRATLLAVAPMARAAVAAGADGLLIEVHPDPERALSDGVQSLYPDQFAQLMKEIRAIAPAVDRKIA